MKLRLLTVFLIAGFGATHAVAQSPGPLGVNVKVDCSHKVQGKLPSINAAMKLLVPSVPNTVTVSGNCNENVVVQGFDRLTLITTTGATIGDASDGQTSVLDIEDSQRVTVQGFTINGGLDGVICAGASACYLTSNTIQASLGQEGIAVSGGAKAYLISNIIKNNGQRGLTVNDGSQVHSDSDLVEGNGATGIVANSGAYFDCTNSTVENNGNGGVVIMDHSTLRTFSCTINGNTGNGVVVQRGSDARFDSATITSNTGNGVLVRDLAFSLFGDTNITGNQSGVDVACAPQYPATRGALSNVGGGTTNCSEQ